MKKLSFADTTLSKMKKTKKKKQVIVKEDDSDSSEEKNPKGRPRENEMLKLSDDMCYRTGEAILAKAKFYTGIHVEDKEKMLEEKHLDFVAFAFEKDNKTAQQKMDFNLKNRAFETVMGKKEENPDPRINYEPGSYRVQPFTGP